MSTSEREARIERLRARRASFNATTSTEANMAECARLDAEIAEAEGQSLLGAGFQRDDGRVHVVGAPGEPPFLNGWGNTGPVAD